MMESLLFHGTGARRRQSIQKKGLLPKLNSYIYASSDPRIATIFAVVRATEEDDWAMVVSFKAGDGWEVDPQFPNSFRRRDPVPPCHIVSVEILHPEKEIEAYDKIKQIAESIGIRVE